MAYVSPRFLILHVASDYLIHPYGGSINPKEGTMLILDPSRANNERLSFRFVQVEGHWGYIEHKGGLIFYPENPRPSDFLILHKYRKDGCLFTIDQVNNLLVHRNGLLLFGIEEFIGLPPLPGASGFINFYKPGSWPNNVEKWKFVSGTTYKDVQIFPNPDPSGYWNIVYSQINPSSGRTEEIFFKIGKTRSTSNNIAFGWEITTEYAKSIFESSPVFTQLLAKTGHQTWEDEITSSKRISVVAGQGVVIWQWVYELEQWGDRYIFKSDILQETESAHEKPKQSVLY